MSSEVENEPFYRPKWSPAEMPTRRIELGGTLHSRSIDALARARRLEIQTFDAERPQDG